MLSRIKIVSALTMVLSATTASAATLTPLGADFGKIRNQSEITVGDNPSPLLYKCNTSGSDCVGEPGKSPTAFFDGVLEVVMESDLEAGKFRVTDPGTLRLPHYVGIKGGPTDSFLYEITGDLTLWTYFDNSDLPNAGGSGAPPAISNITFWNTGPATPVPLPAAGWMLIAAVGGLGAMRRRQK